MSKSLQPPTKAEVLEVGCQNGFEILDIDGLRIMSARGRCWETPSNNEEVRETSEEKQGLPATADLFHT